MPDEVLRRDSFCPGYVDSIGNWNNGFACPTQEAEPMFCCGTATYRYCCTAVREEARPAVPSHSLPLILGVVFGTLVTIILVIVALCFFWRSCRTHQKRHRHGGQLYCVTGGGVANMYSCSPASQGRHDGRGGVQGEEDVLQEVDEVAVTRPCRVSTINTVPRSFTSDRCNRALLADSADSTSVSTTTDTELELYVNLERRLPPPAYQFDRQPLCNPGSITSSQPYFAAGSGDLGDCQSDRSRSPSLFRSTRF